MNNMQQLSIQLLTIDTKIADLEDQRSAIINEMSSRVRSAVRASNLLPFPIQGMIVEVIPDSDDWPSSTEK